MDIEVIIEGHEQRIKTLERDSDITKKPGYSKVNIRIKKDLM